MKLIVGGSTGFVGDSTKLKSIIYDNFESYSNSVKRELEDTDACIWTIAVTPSKLKTVPFEDACEIFRDYAAIGIRALTDLYHDQDPPLHFIYISGHFVPRSPAEVPKELANSGLMNFGLMRGEAESRILAYAEHYKGSVQSYVAEPGLIEAPGRERQIIPELPNIDLREFVAALLDQVVNGLEKDTLLNNDMIRIKQRASGE
ncbi:hypothetical protein GL218_01355 [Daldinia childiae]|uniref:uncharacterized protein n=1 Tax=Daldinia childiae TaxID=326645 RepID=UPI0014472D28|nr:uncharacterized protein GL218_01355 [Daldinia childiae]KAF3064448.1 hypothetical protein GL218_01355 [Daldinia childiae]